MAERNNADLGKIRFNPVPPDARAGDFGTQPGRIKIDKASHPADIGTLVVPENRSDPTTRLIAIPVVRIRSRSLKPTEPIFWLEGGPGESNLKARVPAWLLADHDKVRLITFAMLFRRGSAALVFDAYLAAAQGDPSGLWLMSAASDFMIPNRLTWGDLLAKGTSADFDPARDYARELDPPGAILGSPMALAIWGAAAKAWPVRRILPELRVPQPSDTPTLLVSGSVDFSTPAEFATRELLPLLTNGRQVILREFGHVSDIFSLDPEAVERLLVSFFNTGEADDSLFTYTPMDFQVSLGFPKLAKLILGGCGILLAGLLAFTAYLVLR
jgi:hypothetical protein